MIDKALVLNPNLASAWFLGGFLKTLAGDPDAAIGFLTRATRFSPLDPEMFRMQAGMALSHLFAGRFDTAALWAEQSFGLVPTNMVAVTISAASHALADRTEQARTAIERLRKLDPAFRISSLYDWIPIRRQQDSAGFAAGLRKAGLPE